MGKIGIPDKILGKAGRLSAEEWQLMKKHPNYRVPAVLFPLFNSLRE